ncbi:pyocin knob domain-containing protein [Chryseobacterium indoltheticum]|uniref:Uncharacterized protein n=1 Tax=Chryseobacterium indoltheticum TaxID=254 RepID=A0A381F4H4_9FLAO|nr:pyocin knob domain-containing protein [Chryseobacterium indoltheticum]AZA74944.1 hypothetical protein EG358_14745 [Chryseobacterium indoltheticum]SIQ29406.1 hypothetical protein SAMN05421682_1047 [Chryseobacterium indoltheticum]SUX41397.1 Uncharacterised protein [Chryseobacterium indoltheticum]
MDVKYSYYNTSKGYRVTGGTAAHFLKADGSLDNTSYIPANTEINMGDKNLNFTSGSLSKFENSSRVFNKVYQRSSNANQVGILSFKFPQASTSATMFDVTLKIYGWQNRILGNIRIGFYKITGVAVNGSHKAIIECSDNFPTNIINVGIDAAGMVCINIGEATTVWNTYLNVEVERVVSFHSGANFDWSKGWLQTIETDVSSYISIANVATEVVASRSWTDANNIGSIPKAPTALSDNSLNTITTPGFYNQTADANATIARNYPIANAGSLNVYRTTINGVIQEYTTYNNNITYKRNYNGSSWGVWKTMLNSVDLGSSAITSNTNQTGLTGDKTTSGNWIFNGTGANSLTVLRPGSTINNSIALGFDTPSMYMGLADADTFAVGTNANLVLSNRTFWVDNIGNASLKGNLNFNSELILQRNNVTRFRTSGTDTVISSEGTNIYLRPKGDSSNVNQIIFNNNTSQYTDNHNILLGTQTSVGSSVFHTGVAGALSGYGAWMGHNLQWDGTNFIQPRGNLHSWGFTANNHKGFSFNFGLSTGTNGGIVSLTEVLKIDNSGLITTLNHGNSSQWNTAFNWGNHANAGYATTAQLGLYIPLSQRGAANGVATLDAAGLIPTTQLPSYVDDVIEGASLAVINALPANEKQTGKIYVTTDTNKSYRWSGSVFVEISSGAVQSVNGQTGVVNLTYSDVGASAVNHTHTIAQVTGLQSALDGKVDDSQVLTNVPAGAVFTDTIYTLPTATSTNKGGVEIFSDTVQTVASNTVTAAASRTYGIQLNSAGQAVVNVPWVDTNTAYTAGNGLTLTGTAFSLPITVSGSGNYITDVAQNANGITVTKGNLPSYSLTVATSTSLGGIRLFSDVANNMAPNSVTEIKGRSYAVQLNNNNQAVVNVPWTDSNTIYTSSNGIVLSGTNFTPTYGTTVNTIAQGNDSRINNGETAFGWGNHANAGYLPYSALSNYYTKNESLNLFVKSSGVETISDTKTFTHSPVIPNGTLGAHAVNKSQIELITSSESEGGQQLYISGNNSVNLTNYFVTSRDGSRNPDDITPNSTPRRVRFDFANSTSAGLGGSGNYAGIMTFAPWDGTTASTGDSSYQLAFANQSGSNGAGAPMLKLRKGIDDKWGKWTKFWTDADFTNLNIQQWNYASQYGLKLNEEFSINTGSRLMLADGFYGNESGMMDHTFERFVSGKQNEYYKYGSRYGNFDGLNFNVDTQLFGMGREANKDDKLTVEGSVKASKNFKSEDENPDTLFIPNGNLATLRDEIVNDQSDYAIRLDPHEYNIDPSGVLAVDDRNRLIHIIGEQVKMTVDFKRVYPKQQIVIYNFDQSGGTMAVKIQGKLIATLSARCFLRLYVTKSQRVIAERQQPCDFVW